MKKPGMDVMIAVGRPRPKGGGELSAPGPLDRGGPKKAPSPFGGDDPGAGDEESSDHQAGETPEYESGEEQGAKLISDIEAAGEKHGLDGHAARSFAADVFSAMAECLRQPEGADEGDEPGGSDEMGGSSYGR